MKTLNIHEAKTHLSSILLQVAEKGETYLICRNGTPVADLIPHKKKDRLCRDTVMSKIKINYDPTEPLTSGEWPPEEE
jgi:prevent-host-death family protein